MKKNMMRLIWGIFALIFFLTGCRQETLNHFSENVEKDAHFAVFSKKNSSNLLARERLDFHYQEGFRYLFFRYYDLHPEKTPDYNKEDIALPDFRFASQLLIQEEDDAKIVLVPMIGKKQVIGVMVARVNKDDSYVQFFIPKRNALIDSAISDFRKAYQSRGNPGRNYDDIRTGYIEEVVIEAVQPMEPISFLDIDDNDCPDVSDLNYWMFAFNCAGGMPEEGDCNAFQNCNGGGGLVETPVNDSIQSACDRIKKLFADNRFKNLVGFMDKPVNFTGNAEMGYAEGYPSNSQVTLTNFQQLQVGKNKVIFPTANNLYFGYVHTHTNNYWEDFTAKIFSPSDVATFLTHCVRNAQQHGNIKDAYAMVITSQGNYILQYGGDGNYSIGPNQLTAWQEWYNMEFKNLITKPTYTQQQIESLFVRFLQEKVNISDLEVYKVDKITGESSQLTSTGTPNSCL